MHTNIEDIMCTIRVLSKSIMDSTRERLLAEVEIDLGKFSDAFLEETKNAVINTNYQCIEEEQAGLVLLSLLEAEQRMRFKGKKIEQYVELLEIGSV